MGLPLRNLVSSLESIPAVIKGINKRNLERFHSSIDFPEEIEINYSLSGFKSLLNPTEPKEKDLKNISVGNFDLFSIKLRKDSDQIPYLELTPTSIMKDYLRKHHLFL